MAITDDWEVNFVSKVINHIDGVLDFDSVSNTQDPPQYGDYIRGATSTTVGKIVNGAIGQNIANATGASGTLSLTNVTGRFQNNESLAVLDSMGFDTVQNSGFVVGDTLQNASGAEFTVYALEYHYSQNLPTGYTTAWTDTGGIIYGTLDTSTTFSDTHTLSKTTATATTVALVDTGTWAITAGDAWTGALVNEASETMTPPASKCVIINYNTGTEAIPRFATIQDTNDASPTRSAIVQKTYGVTATGSLRLVDVTGTWADGNTIYVKKVPYDNLQSGQTFKVGDKIVVKSTTGGTVQSTGKIIVVDTLTTTTGKLTLQNMSGTFSAAIDDFWVYVRTTADTAMAQVNAGNITNFFSSAASVTGAEIAEQLSSQGGVYNGSSLNIVRDSNALYTYLQDTFDELGNLDDQVPMTAQVALQQFTLVNGWKIPDLSFRFLESGSIQDSALDNIWTNYQTLGSVEGITSNVYAETTPLPQFYVEQSGSVISTFWFTGHIDVLVKVKTNTLPSLTASATGVLINSGTVTIFNRNFGDTYDHFETTTIAGVAPIPLATSSDLNNTSGTHRITFDGQNTDFTVGEEIRSTTGSITKRGIITAITDSGATGTIDYIWLNTESGTNFADNDALVGEYSAGTGSVTGSPTNLVAGYGTQIVIATVEGTIAGTLTSGTSFYDGELVTQATSSAQGIVMDVTGGTMTLGNVTESTAFDNTNIITGATSSATFDVSGAFSTASTIQRDIQDGCGNQPYNAVIYLDRDGDGSGDTLARMYEWVKYRTRSLETTGEPAYNLLGGPGTSEDGVQGRLYITLDTSYALVKSSPWGTFAGGQFFGARGVFVQDMANADIRNYQLIDANGDVRNPPNQQTLSVTGLVSGDRVAVFRTDPAISSTTIMTDEFQISVTTGGYNQQADSGIQVVTSNRAVPMKSNVPASGVVRILDPADTGLYLSFTFSAIDRTNGRFTLSTTAIQTTPAISDVVTTGEDLTAGDNAFVVFIEQEATTTSVSNNIIYDSTDTLDGGPDFPLLARVRRKGILPFEVTTSFGSSGSTISAIRTFDSIVD